MKKTKEEKKRRKEEKRGEERFEKSDVQDKEELSNRDK